MIKRKLPSIIEELESYVRLAKTKRRDQVYIFQEIIFLAKQALRIIKGDENEKN